MSAQRQTGSIGYRHPIRDMTPVFCMTHMTLMFSVPDRDHVESSLCRPEKLTSELILQKSKPSPWLQPWTCLVEAAVQAPRMQ